jgi:guanosine-3',5'-bis(diphosphate) 3'-pyrophosphohydrolase
MQNIDKNNLETASRQLWEYLAPKISYLPKEDKKVVELAFTQMVLAHSDMRRKSGDFYIIHPVAACGILTELKMDKDSLAACLLHDVPEDTEVTLRELSKDFSAEIVFLVESVTKLSKIRYQWEDRYVENLRRMFVAMSQDLRVIFIKLADRLHNLKTLKFIPEEKQKRIAQESLEIYAPIAGRLGINYFKGAIEDACFPYLYPEIYKEFVKNSSLVIEKRQKQLEIIKKKLEKSLKNSKVNYLQISGRAKRYYSLYKKLQEKEKEFEEVYDLVALRIITENLSDCYVALSTVNKDFVQLDGRVKDYITRPKNNGYQSIHTTIKDEETGIIFEIQIRTKEMNEYAEYGVAAHWAYKEGKKISSTKELEQIVGVDTYKWLSELVELGMEEWSQEEYLKHVKLDLFQDRIFVMTPKNDPINLPKNATPLDFAYKIHRDIGHKASMAIVNGVMAKLNSELQNGDIVEILTNEKQKPTDKWLQWVKTSQAAKQIRIHLKKELK